VAILNEEYQPWPDEVAEAERVVAAYDKAIVDGIGAIEIDGKMIDVPVVERAKHVLTGHRAVLAREAKARR
jgi:citrate lyase subunit beta/citryl-CoA lyase